MAHAEFVSILDFLKRSFISPPHKSSFTSARHSAYLEIHSEHVWGHETLCFSSPVDYFTAGRPRKSAPLMSILRMQLLNRKWNICCFHSVKKQHMSPVSAAWGALVGGRELAWCCESPYESVAYAAREACCGEKQVLTTSSADPWPVVHASCLSLCTFATRSLLPS